MKRILISLVLFGVVLTAPDVFAQSYEGLVPCTGTDCNACHLVELGNNILEFFVQFAVLVATIMFALGGFDMVTSAGDTGKVTKGKGRMTDAVVGIVIVLAAWLMVDTVLKLMLKEQTYGMWNDIRCDGGQVPATGASGSGGSAAGAGYDVGSPTLSDSDIQQRMRQMEQYEDMICEYAVRNGIGDQCATLVALAAVESSGNSSLRSPAGAVGLMQITPNTARSLDPERFKGMTDAQVNMYLSDLGNNIRFGVKNYAELHREYEGDTTLVLAAYNGGRGANAPSDNCDGMLKWQCAWDNDAHTVPNTGYQETRNYVANINEVSSKVVID